MCVNCFAMGSGNEFAEVERHSCRTEDEDHGRVETRYYHVVSIPEALAEKHADWVGLRTLGMVRTVQSPDNPGRFMLSQDLSRSNFFFE